MPELSFSQILTLLITLIVGIIVGVVAIRISLNFDINRYIENRQERLKRKARNHCAHLELIPTGDNALKARSLWVSPPGTTNWICQRCGTIKLHHSNDEWERAAQYYIENIDEYTKMNKKFHKILKKAGLL